MKSKESVYNQTKKHRKASTYYLLIMNNYDGIGPISKKTNF